MKTEKYAKDVLESVDYGKRRLLTYADSFRELAKSLDGDFRIENGSREQVLLARSHWESKQALCENLQEMAQIMTRAASEVYRHRPVEERKRRLILHTLKQERIQGSEVFYIEKQGQRVGISLTMYAPKGETRKAGEVADLLSVVLNKRLSMSVSSPYQVDGVKRVFVLVEDASYLVMTGVARAVRENERNSGDNYAFLEAERGKFTALLSDGTGSGEKAGEDSGRVLDLMEKMIEADFDRESAVNLLNSAVLARGLEQRLATLDLCDLDLYEGTCEFRKVGAAASFIKRDYLVEQIDSHCLPLGVFHTLETEVITCELMDGDYIIMMTDGVLDALGQNRYEETMKRVIMEMKERNPREMAERLLGFVLHCSGGRITDDMTILVMGIWEKNS